MAKKQTDKARYPSKYSPGQFISAAQYICETICEHKARIDGKSLPVKFWEDKEWAKFYKDQISAANKLLKVYSCAAIIEGLNHWKGKKIYSLRAPWLKEIIDEVYKKKDIVAGDGGISMPFSDEFMERILSKPIIAARPMQAKKGIKSTLEDIDGTT